MIIAITGTPGVGKSYLADALAKKGYTILDLNRYAIAHKLYDAYDKKNQTYVIDVKKIEKKLRKIIGSYQSSISGAWKKQLKKKSGMKPFIKTVPAAKNDIIIDSHLSHFMKADVYIVVQRNPDAVRKVLKKRAYSASKIEDNVQSEIFNIILEETQRRDHVITVVNT